MVSWLDASYYNVRTGKKCRITVGDRRKGRIPVKTYREILHQYLYHPESKFAGPDGNPCDPWTRGVLSRRHIVAADFKYCGKEIKRKLEQGPVDHEIDHKCKVYENGRVAGNPETLRQLEGFSEREIANGTGLHRKPIRLFKHGGILTWSDAQAKGTQGGWQDPTQEAEEFRLRIEQLNRLLQTRVDAF